MPSKFHNRLNRERRVMRREPPDRDADRADPDPDYADDIAPSDAGDGHIVRKRIENEGEGLWDE